MNKMLKATFYKTWDGLSVLLESGDGAIAAGDDKAKKILTLLAWDRCDLLERVISNASYTVWDAYEEALVSVE